MPTTTGTVGVVALQLLECERCGLSWHRPSVRGSKPRTCPDCRAAMHPGSKRLDTNSAGYRLGAAVTTYRLAIEEATCALRLGRNAEALAALERVAAPARTMDLPSPRMAKRVA